jgi:hypothetical protein
MTVSRSNLRFYLSGGEKNTDPAASLGGLPSKVSIGRGDISQLFDDVTGLEAESGKTDYRCIYFFNDDPDENGLIDPIIWVVKPPEQSKFSFGVDKAGKNGIADFTGNELTPPPVRRFFSPDSYLTGMALPESPYLEGEFVPVWVKRVTPRGSRPTSEVVVIRIRGETY